MEFITHFGLHSQTTQLSEEREGGHYRPHPITVKGPYSVIIFSFSINIKIYCSVEISSKLCTELRQLQNDLEKYILIISTALSGKHVFFLFVKFWHWCSTVTVWCLSTNVLYHFSIIKVSIEQHTSFTVLNVFSGFGLCAYLTQREREKEAEV